MRGLTLKFSAVACALGVGAVAFGLIVVATAPGATTSGPIIFGLIAATFGIIVGWAGARRARPDVPGALDAAVQRVVAASKGDLSSPTPDVVAVALPHLSTALDGMFAQVRDNLENATALALFDPVTSLANRTHFRAEAEHLLEDLEPQRMALLAFIDLDHFKGVNDNFGHAKGDQVLAKIANRLRGVAAAETVRCADASPEPIIGRLAGDEFTVLFGQVDSADDAARLGAVLLDALTRPIDLGDHDVSIGASIGLALANEHGTTLTQLMRAADVAMYHAKARGRGQFQFYSEAMAERMAQRTRLETDLRNAIANDEFVMAFQPQIALATGAVQAVEGLLRWKHPTDGLRLPDSFLHCAEESGLIGDIGTLAVDALARRVATWPRDALAPRLGVNLSKRQIARPDFFASFQAALKRRRAPLSAIEFEISEAVLMDCGPTLIAQLVRLREQGARIAIDDFGAASSCLARLRSLPFDTVKLDTSLTAGIEVDAAARDVAQAVVGLVHSLGAQAVAEGVENHDQLEVLRVMGCDAAQGYAIAPPMLEADFRTWLANTRDRMVA